MINVFKLGGPWKTSGGIEYTVKAVNDATPYLNDNWSLSIDDIAIEGEYEEVKADTKKKTTKKSKA